MKRIGFLLVAVVTAAGIADRVSHAFGQSDGDSSPIYGVKIPAGYRDWQLSRRKTTTRSLISHSPALNRS
jgi:hypothetical protein